MTTTQNSQTPSQEVNLDILSLLAVKANPLALDERLHAWVEAKKIKPTDLDFAKLLKTDLQWDLFLKSLSLMIEFRATYSESLKYLEIVSDLILMGHEESLFEQSYDGPLWFTHLHRLRYPETAQRDDQVKEKFEKFSWPFGSKVKFERRGDRSGVELKLFISSETDLIKILSALERVKEQIKEINS